MLLQTMDANAVAPVLTVLAYASIAAGFASFGVIPLVGRQPISTVLLGLANSLAAGLMLGAAYSLMVIDPDGFSPVSAFDAILGICYVLFTHWLIGSTDLDLNKLGEVDPTYGYKVLLINTLHGAAEGVAIGVAMVVSIPFGTFVALSIAVHNIPEGTVLSAVLASRGARIRDAATLAIVVNIGQVLLAVATFAVVSAVPVMLPWAAGFAIGALIYLVLAELLPEGYREVGHTSVALVAIVAMGMVVVLTEINL
jgi:zinc transporter ZupT